MAVKYSKITLNHSSGGTIYSETKGNTIIRLGDTIFVSTDGFDRVVNIPWSACAEADFIEFVDDKIVQPTFKTKKPTDTCNRCARTRMIHPVEGYCPRFRE